MILDTLTLNHHVAVAKCHQHNGILPEPRTQEENYILDNLDTSMFVLGMSDKGREGEWVWESDGSSVLWTKWWKQSDNKEHCAVMMQNSYVAHGHWHDFKCDDYMDGLGKHLICQKHTGMLIFNFLVSNIMVLDRQF